MVKTRLIFLFLIFHLLSHAQLSRDQFTRDSLETMKVKLVRPQFKLDNRITWHEGQTLAITGFDAGVLLKDKLRVTIGYYRLNDDLNAFRKTIDSVDIGRLININYGTLNTEFMYRDTRFLSLGMPLEIGLGQSDLKFKNFKTEEIFRRDKGFMAIAHFGVAATFKPIRWIGLKGIVGYRKTIFNQVKEFNFDGPFFSLGLNIDVREIIKDIRMFKLKKKYGRGENIGNAVDLITD